MELTYKIRDRYEDLLKIFTLHEYKGVIALYLTSAPTKPLYCGDITANKWGTVGHNGLSYNIRCVVYCLREKSHYLDHINGTILPKLEITKENPCRFKYDEVQCYITQDLTWKQASDKLDRLAAMEKKASIVMNDKPSSVVVEYKPALQSLLNLNYEPPVDDTPIDKKTLISLFEGVLAGLKTR